MSSGAADTHLLHFSTDQLPETDRIGVWREVYGRTILKLDIEPLPDRPFQADIRMCALPGLGLISGTIHGVRDRRTRALIADGNDDLGLAINLGGVATTTQCGREATLADGDAILLSCSDVGAVTRPSACRYLGVRVPRMVLAALVPDIEDLVAVPIPRGSPGLALLQNYVSGLLSAAEGSASPAVHRLATGHIYDLLALTLVAPSGRAIVADNGGVRAARLRAIKNDIDAGLFSYELSIRSVALKQGVTPRYVQKLFEQEGVSFTEFVRERRLTQAHGLLGDRRFVHLSIGTIAFECGFNDLSYFNRTFRRRYGVTPSDVREQARHGRR